MGDPTLTIEEMRKVAGAHLAMFGRDDAAELLLRAADEVEYLRAQLDRKWRKRDGK